MTISELKFGGTAIFRAMREVCIGCAGYLLPEKPKDPLSSDRLQSDVTFN